MEPPFDPPISTSNLYLPDHDRVIEIIRAAHDVDGRLIVGSIVAELEKQLCLYHDAKHCVAYSTGFWALVAAVRLRALPGRDEVIIPSLTYRRLADVVHWAGKIPVLVDCEKESLAIDCDAVVDSISSDTALILAVHPIVNCCNVERLLKVSASRNVPIIFDAVESVHETIDDRRVGSFGVGEVFSLHASKLINGLEGGYVCTDDVEFRDQLIRFREGTFSHGAVAINAVLCDAHAAFALAGLQEIEQNVAHNREIYRAYQNAFQDLSGLRLLEFDESQKTSMKNVVAEVTEEFALTRDQLVAKLNERNVLARPHYFPALHTRTYRYDTRFGKLETAEFAMNRYINLPCGQRVQPADVAQTCKLIRRIGQQDAAA